MTWSPAGSDWRIPVFPGGWCIGTLLLMNLLAALIAISCLGAGEWSLDNAIDFAPSHWWALVLAGVIGVGGCATLLIVFWRPPQPKAAS